MPSDPREFINFFRPASQGGRFEDLSKADRDQMWSMVRRMMLRGEWPDIGKGGKTPLGFPISPLHPEADEWIRQYMDEYKKSSDKMPRPNGDYMYHPYDATNPGYEERPGRQWGAEYHRGDPEKGLRSSDPSRHWTEHGQPVRPTKFPSLNWENLHNRYNPGGPAKSVRPEVTESNHVIEGLSDVEESFRSKNTVPHPSDALFDMGRMNPVELAKNLGSRVNAGPMGPWDVFPGGIDGFMNYITNELDLPNPLAERPESELF